MEEKFADETLDEDDADLPFIVQHSLALHSDSAAFYHSTFVGICVQDIEQLFLSRASGTSLFGKLNRDTCETHKVSFRSDCRRCCSIQHQFPGTRAKGCFRHSRGHDFRCEKCVMQRWESQERCRTFVTKIFAELLHQKVLASYRRRFIDETDFAYPEGVEKICLPRLMEDVVHCEKNLTSLWNFNGHSNGCLLYTSPSPRD